MDSQYPKFKIKKTKLGEYPNFSVSFSITLALFVIGIFSTLIIYSKELEKIVREEIKVQVFLQNNTTEVQQTKISKALASKYFTADDTPKKPAVQFVSKDKAAKQFIRETGEDFQQLLGENPLRSAFIVKIAETYQDAKSLAIIKNDIEKMRGVFQVYYVENVIDSINKNIVKISLILSSIGVLLLLIAILLINNSVKLALFSQRFLIRSMQLVGATSWFIQRSFLYKSLANGLISGIMASLLLLGAIYLGNKHIDGLQLIYNSKKIFFLLVILIILGVSVSLLGIFRSVNKFLKLSLDELH